MCVIVHEGPELFCSRASNNRAMYLCLSGVNNWREKKLKNLNFLLELVTGPKLFLLSVEKSCSIVLTKTV